MPLLIYPYLQSLSTLLFDTRHHHRATIRSTSFTHCSLILLPAYNSERRFQIESQTDKFIADHIDLLKISIFVLLMLACLITGADFTLLYCNGNIVGDVHLKLIVFSIYPLHFQARSSLSPSVVIPSASPCTHFTGDISLLALPPANALFYLI